MREIPQRDLRNDVSAVLRDVAAGETVRVTVRGRPVAQLSPIPHGSIPRRLVPWGDLVDAFGEVGLTPEEQVDLRRDIDSVTDDEPRDPFAGA